MSTHTINAMYRVNSFAHNLFSMLQIYFIFSVPQDNTLSIGCAKFQRNMFLVTNVNMYLMFKCVFLSMNVSTACMFIAA